MRLRSAIVLAALVLTPCVAPEARAQFVSVGVGAGGGAGRHNGPQGTANHAHALGYVQLGVPLLPVSLRGDVLLIGKGTTGGPVALTANAVVSLPIPVVTPYLTGGWGSYGLAGGTARSGVSAGAGVRVKLPVLPGVFGEVRRHHGLGRDLLTVGVIL